MVEQVVSQIRAEIFTATNGLTASAGIAPNRRLAKICSEKNKPNGQFHLFSDRAAILDFLAELPLRKVFRLFFSYFFFLKMRCSLS